MLHISLKTKHHQVTATLNLIYDKYSEFSWDHYNICIAVKYVLYLYLSIESDLTQYLFILIDFIVQVICVKY